MNVFCILSGENQKLATAEIESLFSKTKKDSRIRSFRTNHPKDRVIAIGKRLAYSRFGAELLFTSKLDKLEQKLASFDWQRKYKENFRVSITDFSGKAKSAKHYGSIVWKTLKNPKVDLMNPVTDIRIAITNKLAYVGILLWENDEDFESRKAH